MVCTAWPRDRVASVGGAPFPQIPDTTIMTLFRIASDGALNADATGFLHVIEDKPSGRWLRRSRRQLWVRQRPLAELLH
ncbi:protein of unknown function (plasmid) [Cupriavidus neocaledonicus]|uniref:Uncharacterized protein n=1 Tax=Cupriavidus neocaledonicus TaxID=1040979 RepID=A0A375HW88_9BURK|nr:protein of unknown function [Cupriavidus neocaledonicus]